MHLTWRVVRRKGEEVIDEVTDDLINFYTTKQKVHCKQNLLTQLYKYRCL